MLAYTYFNKLSFARWSDYAAPGVVLAQAIGRWGNYINQELYGYATTLPWGITIDAAHRIPPFDNLAIFPLDTRFHPTFLYESLWNLLCFGLLMLLARRYGDRLLDGDVFLAYLILYPVGRFFVEGLRPDAWKVSSIPVAQIIALVSIAGAGAALWYRHHVAPRAVAAASQVSEEEQEE